ncbi:MAG TPA: isoprenylcysteine carboxylmethyltransferase family protein [Actinomycetota bacterium]|nr:isoprenylcysteine carboxylmethyltransferase family protein [Actinomycetota bacterium]
MDRVTTVVVSACWVVVAVVWIAGAVYGAAKGPAVRSRGHGSLPWILAAAGIWLVVFPHGGRGFDQRLAVHDLGLQAPGIAVVLTATAFTLWARAALGTMWSWAPVTKEGHQLRTTGPYAITRHPIYTGLIGMLAGTALAQGSLLWGVLVLAVVVGLYGKIREEERLMANQFPADYPDYRRRVPQLVPGLKALHGGHAR